MPHELRIDGNGEFSARGVVVLSLGAADPVVRCHLRGRVVKDTMTLHVELTPGGPEIAFTPFTLVRGRPAEMPFCALG